MPSSFLGASLHYFSHFLCKKCFYSTMTFTCAQKVDLHSVHEFFYGGSSFEGNSTVWQLHHFRDSSESFDLQSRQLWEQGKRTASMNAWFSHMSLCSLSLFHLLLDHPKFPILHSSYAPFGQAGPDLIDFVNILGNCALKGELKLAKFPGKEYMERWLEDEQIDIKLTSIPGKEYGKMMRSSAAKLARMDFQVVAQQKPERTLWS